MPKLRDSPDDLAALIARTADHLELSPTFVEKDFWVTEVLRAAVAARSVPAKNGTEHGVELIFKGGTSLSRVFGLIERFSEDVDLLISFPPHPETSAKTRDAVLKGIRDTVAAHLDLSGPAVVAVTATTGMKRNVRYNYPARFASESVSASVLLEMGCRGGTFPTSMHRLRSMGAEFAVSTLDDDPSRWAEFAPFEITVLGPERTLLEKLALLHDAACRYPNEEARRRLLRAGRHFYDVYRLLGSEAIRSALAFLGTSGVAELANDIDEHSARAGFSFTERPADGFGASPLATASRDLLDIIRSGYRDAIALVYGDVPTITECLARIRASAELL